MKSFAEFIEESAGKVSVYNSEGYGVHTDGKRVWASTPHATAAAPPSLSNFHAGRLGYDQRSHEVKTAVLAAHHKGQTGVAAAMNKLGYAHHKWK